MNQHQIELFSSKKSDDWATPQWLYKELDNEFHFNFDPCPLNAQFDGLKIPWEGNIFVNPPYSKIKKFLIKAHEELRGGRKSLYFLYLRTLTQDGFTITFMGSVKLDF